MKKVIAFFKSLFATPAEPVVVPAPVVEEAPKAKKEVVAVAEEAAPKKKKRYYKPKNKA